MTASTQRVDNRANRFGLPRAMLRFCGFKAPLPKGGVATGSSAVSGPPLARVVAQRSRSRSMPIVMLPPLCANPEFCVVSRWNLSLTAKTRWRIFGLLATLSLSLASGFVAAGAWMVLPYSVLELTILALAFRYIERRALDWERLTVSGDRVIVERCMGGARERREWNRPWVRTELEQSRFGRRRLLLRCGGERWEFGNALAEPERNAVARELKRLIGTHATV